MTVMLFVYAVQEVGGFLLELQAPLSTPLWIARRSEFKMLKMPFGAGTTYFEPSSVRQAPKHRYKGIVFSRWVPFGFLHLVPL